MGACAAFLATGAVLSAPSARPIASIVVQSALASEAPAGQTGDSFVGTASQWLGAPQSVLLVAMDSYEATLGIIRSGVLNVEAALASGDPVHAQALADELLARLKVHADAGHVGDDIALPIAKELCGFRAEAIWARDGAPAGSQGRFLKRVVAGASLGDWRYGVPASITIAQAILESDWGGSAPGHNLFGMKGTGPAGSIARRVVEYHRGVRSVRSDPFRAYHDESEALADHARILGTGKRYSRARSHGDDRHGFAAALVGIYASDPRYAQKLDRLIRSFTLERFDWKSGAAQTHETTADAVPVVAEAAGDSSATLDAVLYPVPATWPETD